MISNNGMKWLQDRGFEPEQIVNSGVYTTSAPNGEPTTDDRAEWAAFPFVVDGEVVNIKYRFMGYGEEKRWSQSKGGSQVLYNRDCLKDETLKDAPLIITEGEMDCIAALQAGFPKCVSVPGGAPNDRGSKKYPFIDEAWGLLRACNEIIIASDSDENGCNLRDDLIERFGKPRCKVVTYPHKAKGTNERCKDLNEVLQLYGEDGVRQTINRAKPVSIGGMVQFADIPDAPPLNPTRVQGLGQDFASHISFCRRQVSVWTGRANMGKSAVMRHVMRQMTVEHGWRIGLAAFEDEIKQTFAPDMVLLHKGAHPTPEDTRQAEDWLDQFFTFMIPEDDNPPTVPWALEVAEACVRRNGCDVIVIDPWTEFDLELNGRVTEVEVVKNYITAFTRFAKRFNVHVAIIAHPRKSGDYGGAKRMPDGYDISGAAHFVNKCHLGVTVQADQEVEGLTDIWVWKVKHKRVMGKTGRFSLSFDSRTGRFSECSRQQAQFLRGEEPEETADILHMRGAAE